MDQTISEVVYKARINTTVNAWNEQMKDGNVGGGTIVASDGHTYKKGADGRLYLVIDSPEMKKSVKFLNNKLSIDGLLKTSEVENVEVATSEFVASELCN